MLYFQLYSIFLKIQLFEKKIMRQSSMLSNTNVQSGTFNIYQL